MKKYYRFIGILILILIFTRVDFSKIIIQLSRINMPLFLLINLLVLPSIFFRSCRWRALIRLQGLDYSIRDSFIAYLGGIYAGIITPGRVGEAVKAVYLKQEKNISYSEGMASVFLDRAIDLYALILLSVAASLGFINIKDLRYNLAAWAVIFFLLLVPYLLINKPIMEKLSRAIYKSLISGLDANLFKGGFKIFFSATRKILAQNLTIPVFFTFLAFLVYLGQCYFLARLTDINISFIAVVMFVSISSLVSVLPVTIFGIGTREATMIYLFSLIGLASERALAYSFLLFFSLYIPTAVFGFAGWYIKGRNK